jgi:phosphate transport system permease protein
VLVIGSNPILGKHLFEPGYSLAAVIANEFGEAANVPIYKSALFEAGLVLFILTLLVNILARWFVSRGTRGQRSAGGAAAVAVEAGPPGGV